LALQTINPFGPKSFSEGITINPFTNICEILFVITSELDREGSNFLKGHEVQKEFFSEILFGHNGLPSIKYLSQYLIKKWGSNVSTRIS